ncbi:hypothetical protein FCIRC_4166 [Fusarium circinatum]|uniref:Extracellular membrane protein CFEM domain-containing protein n=1 Tax=Fusarium circinatum TaxID=48490 RepID=A0A8H5UAL4_FUSCI|nr:hypothetical protein FCIRC_4166 [Fusarium circinatum]
MVRASALLILSLFGSALGVAAPQFDQGAELRKSECDATCMCNQKKYREAYFCCMAKKCDSDVMPESVERQHTECQARNLDFTFDAEKVCGIKFEASSTSAAASTTRDTITTSHSSDGSLATSVSASTTSDAGSTSSTEAAKSASSTAQESSTGGAAPVTDRAPRLGAPLGVLMPLFPQDLPPAQSRGLLP